MLFALCALAPFLFLFASLLIGFISANYSQQHSTISYLVHGNYGYLQTINFILCGLLIIALAYVTRNATPINIRNAYLIKIGIWVLGISLLLLGLFPTDRIGQHTFIGQLHGLIFIASVVIQAFLQIAFALSNMRLVISVSLLAGGAVTALGLPSIVLFDDWRGIIQRVLVAAIMYWVTTGAFILRG